MTDPKPAPGATPDAPSRRPREGGWLWLVPCVLVPALLAVPLLQGRVFVYRDLLHFIVPQQALAAAALAAGRLPQWNPLVFGGLPFLAEPGTGVFYLPNLVFQFLRPEVAATLFVLLHLPVAAAGMGLLARGLGLSRPAAALAAVGYVTSGYLLSMHGGHYYLASAALFPLCVGLLLKAADTGSPRWVVAAGACVGAMGLNGEPQTLLLALGGGIILGLTKTSCWRRAGAALATAIVLGLLLGAVQLIPSWLYAQSTARGEGLPLTTAAMWSLHPARWLEFLVLNPFGTSYPENTYWGSGLVPARSPFPWAQSHYLGPVFVGGLLLLPLRRLGARLQVLAALVLVALVLAAGLTLPAFQLWHQYVPFVGGFRYPEKYALVSALGLVLLGAASLDWIPRESRRRWLLLGLAALLGVAALWAQNPPPWLVEFARGSLALSMAEPMDPLQALSSLPRALAHAALLCLMVFAVWQLGARRAGLTAPLALGVATVIGLISAMQSLSYGEVPFMREAPPWAEAARAAMPEGSTGRLGRDPACTKVREPIGAGVFEQVAFGRWSRGGSNMLQLWGLADSEGEVPLVPEEKRRLRRELPLLARWRAEGVAAVLACGPDRTEVRTLPGAIPRAAVVSAEAASAETILRRLSEQGFDHRRTGLVEEPIAVSSAGGRATVHDESPEKVVVRTQGDQGLLVLADTFLEGWTASLDGAPVSIHRVDLLWRGVLVPAGEHEVVFAYRTPGLLLGALLGGAGCLACLALLIYEIARRRTRTICDRPA